MASMRFRMRSADGLLGGGFLRPVDDEFTQRRILAFADGGFERKRVRDRAQKVLHALLRNSQSSWLSSRVVGSRPRLLLKVVGRLHHAIDGFESVDRYANRSAVVADGPGDRLADPPGRVGAESEAALRVELLDGAIRPMLPS